MTERDVWTVRPTSPAEFDPQAEMAQHHKAADDWSGYPQEFWDGVTQYLEDEEFHSQGEGK